MDQSGADGNDFGNYNNLNALASNYHRSSMQQ
jgi:hypothetical protein